MPKPVLILLAVLGAILFAGACAAGWWIGRAERAKAMSRVQLGGRTTSGGYSLSPGHVVIDAPKPGSFFGTITVPGGSEQFAYYVIFKYDPYAPNTSSGGSSGSSSGGTVAESNNSFELNGKQVAAKYKVSFVEAATPGKGETLTLGSQSFDINQGRVFLIDLTENAPTYRQKNLPLPPVGTKLDSSDALKKVATETQADLARQDAEIDKFLK